MRIRVSEAALVPDLVQTLLRNGCVVDRDGATTCTVVHVHAVDAAEAETELRFFVRAWSALHDDADAVVFA